MNNKYNSFMLQEWLTYIQSINPLSIDLSLKRIQEVAIILNLLPFRIYTVLIGGTNGKGSTCFLLEKILLKNKIRVGLYTSPHLLYYKERIRVCGKELSDYIHIRALSVVEKARRNVALTYFEFITLSALYIFKKFKLDLVILEVGLGGRLDATNIIDPDLSVITNISMDHMELLGNTQEQIAIEKSGIFRSKKLAVIGDNHYPIVVDQIAKYQKVNLFIKGRHWDFICNKHFWDWIDYSNHRACLINLPYPSIPLGNAAVVLSILRWLPFKIYQASICFGLNQTVLLGRFQIINSKPLIILDVGHNPHAAKYIVNRLSTMISDNGVVRIVIGMLRNKDIRNTLYNLSSLVDVWYFAKLDTPLSATIRQLSDCCSIKTNSKYFNNIADAWTQALMDSNINDCILVFGSFYAINAILKLIIYGNQYNNDLVDLSLT